MERGSRCVRGLPGVLLIAAVMTVLPITRGEGGLGWLRWAPLSQSKVVCLRLPGQPRALIAEVTG
jgi:hypothetical protein